MMECCFCGVEPAEPETMRPVYEVVTVGDIRWVDDIPVTIRERQVLADEPHTVCEDCYPEAFEPERLWRLEHECPKCWRVDCRCNMTVVPQ